MRIDGNFAPIRSELAISAELRIRRRIGNAFDCAETSADLATLAMPFSNSEEAEESLTIPLMRFFH